MQNLINLLVPAVLAFLNSAVGVTLIASAVLYGLNRLYAVKPLWQKYEGILIHYIRLAEKQIPDDTPSKGAERLDYVLRQALKIYEEVEKRRASPAVELDLRSGISIVHDKLEASDRLAG